jgi:hypothetical protein
VVPRAGLLVPEYLASKGIRSPDRPARKDSTPTTLSRSKYVVLIKVMKSKGFRFQTILLPSMFYLATFMCGPTIYDCHAKRNISPHFKYMVA